MIPLSRCNSFRKLAIPRHYTRGFTKFWNNIENTSGFRVKLKCIFILVHISSIKLTLNSFSIRNGTIDGINCSSEFFYEGTQFGDCQVDTKNKMLKFLASPKIFFVDQGLFYLYILIFKLSYLAVEKSLRGRS